MGDHADFRAHCEPASRSRGRPRRRGPGGRAAGSSSCRDGAGGRRGAASVGIGAAGSPAPGRGGPPPVSRTSSERTSQGASTMSARRDTGPAWAQARASSVRCRRPEPHESKAATRISLSLLSKRQSGWWEHGPQAGGTCSAAHRRAQGPGGRVPPGGRVRWAPESSATAPAPRTQKLPRDSAHAAWPTVSAAPCRLRRLRLASSRTLCACLRRLSSQPPKPGNGPDPLARASELWLPRRRRQAPRRPRAA